MLFMSHWIDDEGKIHRGRSRPTPTPVSRTPTSYQSRRKIYCSDRSYVIAGILAIEFGSLGIHDFYIKKRKTGFIRLAVTLASLFFMFNLGFVIPFIVLLGVWIWGIVDGILIFVGTIDRDGERAVFWRRWFVHLSSAEYVRPTSYPHVKAWIITAIATLVNLVVFIIPLLGI